MSNDDFMSAILAEGEAPAQVNEQSRALDLVKKFNLPSRFVIHTDKPIAALSGSFAHAFEVDDTKQKADLYALILPSNIPIRFHSIQQLKSGYNSNFSNVVESGLTTAGGGQYGNYAVVLERPRGIKFADFVKEKLAIQKKEEITNANKETKSVLPEDYIASEIVAPINEILKSLSDNGVSHGRINHLNIYVKSMEDPKITLGECISEPCGFSQIGQYESIERAMCVPLGKGNATLKQDYFALGVLIYYCIFGEMPASSVDISELIKHRINKGSYNYYTGSGEISPRMTDILRGLLIDSSPERWGYDQVLSWTKGKRFNLIRPNVRKEAARNYEFNEALFSNKRALALAYHAKWDEASLDIRDKKLPKWLELSTGDKNTANEVSTVVSTTGGEKTKSRHDNDELVAKTLLILDNDAPIRFRDLAMHLDGMGAVLSYAWARQNQAELQHFIDVIKMSLPDFKAIREADSDKVDRWTLQRQQNYIKYKSLGFGIERVLYDLNPTLPCQSSMLANQFIIDCSQLLFYLNDNAAKLSGNDPVDRHVAAFIASRLELATEIKLKIMARFGRNENALLQITKLAILAYAQKKTRVPKLPALSNWMVEKLKVVVNSMHGKTNKKDFTEELKNLANQGSLESMLGLITSSDFFAKDEDGFNDAKNLYGILDNDLKLIKAREKLNMGQDVFFVYGMQFAKMFAALVFIVTLGLMVL